MTKRRPAEALVHIDEPHVRATEYRFAPGAETGWHRHPADYVVVPLADGALLLEEPGGTSRTVPLARHVPYSRREGVEHNVVNASPGDFAFLEVEILRPENDAVRAMLDRFAAAWNAHDIDGVMACFTDDCDFWSSAGPHPQGGIHQGREAVAKASRSVWETFPDAAWTEGAFTILGDRALWEWVFTGTGPDGVPVRVHGVDLLDLADGLVRRKNSFRKSIVPRG